MFERTGICPVLLRQVHTIFIYLRMSYACHLKTSKMYFGTLSYYWYFADRVRIDFRLLIQQNHLKKRFSSIMTLFTTYHTCESHVWYFGVCRMGDYARYTKHLDLDIIEVFKPLSSRTQKHVPSLDQVHWREEQEIASIIYKSKSLNAWLHR